jgi:hypothetical protein
MRRHIPDQVSATYIIYNANSSYWCILGCMSKTRVNIYLNEEQKKLLERLSAHTGAPVAELVRRAVDNYLALRKRELK